jgi:cell wall-associated NlpC family hydrolase
MPGALEGAAMTGRADAEELAELGRLHQAAARELYGLANDVRMRVAALSQAGVEAYGLIVGSLIEEGETLARMLIADERAVEVAALRVEGQIAAVEAAGGAPLAAGSAQDLWLFSTTQPAGTSNLANPIDARLVATADEWLGEPYGWGGGHGVILTPHSAPVDCSGLVDQVYGINGINLHGGTAQSLYDMSHPVADVAAAQPGDLVFYGGSSTIHHVAIYIGNGEMIEAPRTGETVHVTALRTDGDFAGIRDLLNSAGAQ